MKKAFHDKIIDIEKSGKKRRGQSALLRYLRGERITRGPSIDAHCYDCSGYGADGQVECDLDACPLWPWSPYKVNPPNENH